MLSRMLQRWTLLIYVVTLVITGSTQAFAQFEIEPESVVQAEGLEAVFECLVTGAVANVWTVNGLNHSTFPTEIGVISGTSGNPSLLTIPASSQFNNSVIQCEGVTRSGGVTSRNVTLTVERVAINVVNGDNNISITVTNSFTTNLTYQLDVTLTNTIVATVSNMSNQFDFNYPNHSFCDVFSFTVTPTTTEMEGTSSEPVTGFFTRTLGNGENVLVSRSGPEKSMRFMFTVPNCTTFSSYKVESSLLPRPITQSITDPLFDGSLDFSLPTDQKGEYTVTLTDVNNSELVFENIPISTFDIQQVFLTEDPAGGVKVNIEYAQNTLSPGALVCVLPRTNDGLDILRMKLVAIPRGSDNFLIRLPKGEYSFVVFDLENENGNIPRMPTSRAAVIKNITVTSGIEGSLDPIPNNEDITVTVLSNQDVQVTCPQPLNCLVLVQSLASFGESYFGFIDSSSVSTIVSVDNIDNSTYAVVYSWREEESVFEGMLSYIGRLFYSPTTTDTPDGFVESTPGVPIDIIIAGVAAGIIFFIVVFCIIFIPVFIYKKKKKKGNAVAVSSTSTQPNTYALAEISNNNDNGPLLANGKEHDQKTMELGSDVP